MKKYSYFFLMFVLFLSACAVPASEESELSLLAPNGGETFEVNEAIPLQYDIGAIFSESLVEGRVVELYLINEDGLVQGRIGVITDYTSTYLSWDPNQLEHWGGLDTTFSPPDSGEYKVLLLARDDAVVPTEAVDYPVDILTDGFAQFDGENIVRLNASDVSATLDLLASDVSDDLFTISGEEVSEALYEDSEYGVSFKYPAHWGMREGEGYTLFAANFDYLDGLSENSSSTELEGTLSYEVIQNSENLTLQEFYDASYEDCMSTPVSEEADFGPICRQVNLEEWIASEIDGYSVYQSDWDGIPESGEIGKNFCVDLKGKGVFICLSAIKTGITDEKLIEKTAEDAFESLGIE